MFLIDSAEAAKDWDGIIEFITKMLTKYDAEIVSIRKWDERPLAYTIRRCARGTYILAYFRVDGPKISDIERDVRLSERIMRVLILNAEDLAEADIAKDTPATRAERPSPRPEERGEVRQEIQQAEPQAAEAEIAEPEQG